MTSPKMIDTANRMIKYRRIMYSSIIDSGEFASTDKLYVEAKEKLIQLNKDAERYLQLFEDMERKFCTTGVLLTDDFIEMLDCTSALMDFEL